MTSNAADSFTYTVSDGHGGTRSATINLSVVDTPGLLSINSSNSSKLTVGYYGIPGYDYVLQRSSNLIQWSAIATNALPWSGGSAGLLWHTETPPHNPAFYRATLP